MESVLGILNLVLMTLLIGCVAWLAGAVLAGRRDMAAQAAGNGALQQQIEALKAAQDGTRDNIQQSLQASQESISRSLQSSQSILGELNNQIGRLQGTNIQMLRVSTEVRRLQDILSSPKLRGQMGESSLENLLANVLPADSYSLQYTFRDGQRIDAIVRVGEHMVPIDAKFPLPAFEALIGQEDPRRRQQMRRQFLKDVSVHVDKIASAYIRPGEGTLDFALLYIPAENIYYETIIKYKSDGIDVVRYCLDKKVIPVSPNLLYAYLMTVAMGLHGLRIEAQATEICRNLTKLDGSLADFVSTWDVLGTHLRNAYGKYDECQRKLDRFGLQLNQIHERSLESSRQEVAAGQPEAGSTN